MGDEVPVALADDLRPEGRLAQRTISVHVEDPQAGGVDENPEESAGVRACVVFKGHERLVAGQGCHPSLERFHFRPFDVEFDQRRHIAGRQSFIENTDVDVDFFESVFVIATYVKPAARIRANNAGETPTAGGVGHGRLSHVYSREGLPQISGTLRKRFERNVLTVRCVPNHVAENAAGVGTDVDAICIGRQRQREQQTQRRVVSHRPPGLLRPDGTLHGAQLRFQSCAPGDPQYLMANGGHDTERIIDAARQ